MGRLISFFLFIILLLTGCSKIRSVASGCKTKVKKAVNVLTADFAQECPDEISFYNYSGFRDWYRFPVRYPYHFLMTDTLEFGRLEKYTGGDIRNPNASSIDIEECSNIIRLSWDQENLFFERSDQRFGIFSFETGKCRLFESSSACKTAGYILPELKNPAEYFKEFRK